MKIAFIGGHLTPALSLMDYAREKGDECLFIGRLQSSKDHHIESREKAEVENRQVTFISIDSAKINRHKRLESLASLPKLATALVKSYMVLLKEKPDVIVSFGGYLAVPVVIAGKLLSIPIFTHEQTRVFGLANQVIALFANKIGLSWKDTQGIRQSHKTIVTGNPLRAEVKKNAPKPAWVSGDKPIMYVTGGSQGSAKINQCIKELLATLTTRFYVIHQCGTLTDFEMLSSERITLDESAQANYTVRTWFSASEVAWILEHARFAVTRSGANTIAEMIERTLPGILIPLPNAGKNEQYQNALMLSQNNASVVVSQETLSGAVLLETIDVMLKNVSIYRKNLEDLKQAQIKNPEELIYGALKEIYASKHH
jgi:UDP-N-acetylglucosamine--N-acetylmuramyl-(pentapeptide) pyrophosphoryl-undecaprenol N-acetylglucosamine transferase